MNHNHIRELVKIVEESNIPSFLGSYSEVSSSEETSSTASKDYQNKVRLTTSEIPDGKYKISWYFDMSTDNKGEMEVEVLLDDSKELFKVKTKEDEESSSGFVYKNISKGIHTLDINFKAKKGTASLKMTTIEIVKIT